MINYLKKSVTTTEYLWTIGAPFFLIYYAVIIFMASDTYGVSSAVVKVSLFLLATLILLLFLSIYERNRMWAEVCNERARDIERAFNSEGATLAYLKFVATGKLTFKNTDEDGNSLLDRREESMWFRSYHIGVRIFGLTNVVVTVVIFLGRVVFQNPSCT